MKSQIIFAIIGIGVGFTAGWLAKPGTPATSSLSSLPDKVERVTVEPRPQTMDHSSEKTALSARVTDLNSDDLKTQIETTENMFTKAAATKNKARLAQLAKELDLTSEQEAQIIKALEKKKESPFDGIDFSDPEAIDTNAMTASLLGLSVDDIVSEFLTEEQQESYTELQKREFDNKVESHALQGLAQLSKLNLSREQKDAVYDQLYSDAETSLKNQSPEEKITSRTYESMGILDGSSTAGLASIFQHDTKNFDGDPEDFSIATLAKKARERITKQADEKTEKLRDVLTPDQLLQYRQQLLSQYDVILSTMEMTLPTNSDATKE